MKTNKNKEDFQLGFRIAEIYTDRFEIYGISSKIPDKSELQHQHDMTFSWDDEVDYLSISSISLIKFRGEPIVEIGLTCGFEFNTPDLLKDGDKVIIPKQLAQHLAGITYSTSRGALHAKTENTPVNQILLPLGNIISLFNEDVILEDVKDS